MPNLAICLTILRFALFGPRNPPTTSLEHNLFLEYPQHSHIIHAAPNLMLPLPRIKVIIMNFRYQFVKVWNELSENVKDIIRCKTFKRCLIEYFIIR